MSRECCLAADLPEILSASSYPMTSEPSDSDSDTHAHSGLNLPQSLTLSIFCCLALSGGCEAWLTGVGP